MEETTNLKMPLLIPNQSGKEITHNEALIIIDNILQNGIIDKDLTTPPENPNTNDMYIVGEGAIGKWEGKDNYLAFYDNGWRFIEPREGFTFWVNDEDKLYTYNGSKWIATIQVGEDIENNNSTTPTTPPITKLSELEDVEIIEATQYNILQHNGEKFINTSNLQQLSMVGINTQADENNKLSIKSDYVLFDNNGNSSKIKVNKATETDTASHLFQNNYSGRAEFGLIGDDDFSLKVSSDGSVWNNSFVVNKNTGDLSIEKNLFLSQEAKENLVSMFMPSSQYVDLSVTSGTNNFGTAPDNGYIVLQVEGCSHYRVWNTSVGESFGIWNHQGTTMSFGSGFFPIAKGQQWGIYTENGNIVVARFYYLSSFNN